MSIAALEEYTRIAKYARYLSDKQRRETWDEQVTRMFDMHREKFKDKLPFIAGDIFFAEKMVRAKKVLGSQRALQFGGEPIFKHEARLYNCCTSYADRPQFFQECVYLLLTGCGIGFSVQKHHVTKFPEIRVPDKPEKLFEIPDCIEGWADAVGVLLSSYFIGQSIPFPDYQGHRVTFSYDKIRPEGAPLSFGAKAPGPEGLRRSLEIVRDLLDGLLAEAEAKLKPINVYDIVMHCADFVISGGVRRSATIALFSPDDEEMAAAKTGDWFLRNPQRGRSNNSAVLIRDETSFEQFRSLMENVREYGEPGFIWSESREIGINPCAEISMFPALLSEGHLWSGWQACNLTEINGKQIRTLDDFLLACKAASVIGTLQAAYTNFPYLGPTSEGIVRREALLGVSITGIMDSPDILFDPTNLQLGAEVVKQTNAEMAAKLGINPAARTTCVKPAGSTSCMLGSSSGIHPHHAKRYFRRVQANRQEIPLHHFERVNPRAVEDCVWDPNKVTKVITFLCEVPENARTKNQISAIEFLEKVKLVQQNWVIPGTNPELCIKPWLRHNVSNTIAVKEDEWDSVTRFIYDNRECFTGISLIPSSGDKDYPQAPFCAVPYPRDVISEYGPGALFASGIIEHALRAFDDNLWAACDELLGITETITCVSILNGDAALDAKLDWLLAATKFAGSHFNSNLRRMTYCLKDVYNIKLWEKLSKEYKEVDWAQMKEDHDTTRYDQELACAGGQCELPPDYLDQLNGALNQTG